MNHLIKIIFLFCILVANFQCSAQLEDNDANKKCEGLQNYQKVPQKFALLTMTYNRNGKMDVFASYLQHYATMKCDGFDQIYIVWNNQQSPQSLGIYQNQKQWINKVIITKTPTNKIDWKYSIPYNSQQQIFLALDDDERTSCREMMKLFNSWKTYAIGKIGPLFSFAQRAQTYNYQTNTFQYLDPASHGDRKTHYFSVALMGCGFVSRHFMDLYYSDLQVIVQMRKIVQQKQNCEDILMNFIVSYFYPQIISKSMHIQFTNAGQKFSGLSKRKTHKTDRHYCLNRFSQILGYNPLRKIKFQDAFKENIQRMDFSCLIRHKKQYLQSQFKRKTIDQIFSQKSAPSQQSSSQQQSIQNQNLERNNQQQTERNNQQQTERNNQQQTETFVINQQTAKNIQNIDKSEQVNKQNSDKISQSIIVDNDGKQKINPVQNRNQNMKNKNNDIYQKQTIQKNSQRIQSSKDRTNIQNKYENDFSSLSGALPLQIQILLISTLLLLLIVMVVLKKSQKKQPKVKQLKNSEYLGKTRQKFTRSQAKQESSRIIDNQHANQIDTSIQIQ